jgi:hypothetical protein
LGDKFEKCPPIADFCELHVRLYTTNLNNLSAKSPIVSGLHLKYSRFLETATGDRVRSALRGAGRSLAHRKWPICLTNNAAERALRGFALGRKSWLFAGSERGADRAAIMATLIMTAKLNDVDPQAWLADVLAGIADTPTRSAH